MHHFTQNLLFNFYIESNTVLMYNWLLSLGRRICNLTKNLFNSNRKCSSWCWRCWWCCSCDIATFHFTSATKRASQLIIIIVIGIHPTIERIASITSIVRCTKIYISVIYFAFVVRWRFSGSIIRSEIEHKNNFLCFNNNQCFGIFNRKISPVASNNPRRNETK